VQDRYILTIED